MLTTKEYELNDNKYFCLNCCDQNYLIECNCGCGNIIFRYDNHYRLKRYFRYHSINGELHHNWNGGRKDERGYQLIFSRKYPNKKYPYIREHRLVYEEYYNVCLLPWIEIHHKDGNKKNNEISNLLPVYNTDHGLIHNPIIDKSDRFCVICKDKSRIVRLKNGKNYEQWYGNKNDGWVCWSCQQFIYRFNKKLLGLN